MQVGFLSFAQLHSMAMSGTEMTAQTDIASFLTSIAMSEHEDALKQIGVRSIGHLLDTTTDDLKGAGIPLDHVVALMKEVNATLGTPIDIPARPTPTAIASLNDKLGSLFKM